MLASYISVTQFSVSGDHTSEFLPGRRIKADCGVDGFKYSTVKSSSYSDPNTTVVIDENELTSNLLSVLYGIVNIGVNGSLPKHSHNSIEGQGGEISFLNLTDTPTTYSGTKDKFLVSTSSGVDFVVNNSQYHGVGQPNPNIGRNRDYYEDIYSRDKYVKTSSSGTVGIYDVTQSSKSIGQENPSYRGKAFDNVINDANATGSWYAYDGGSYINYGWVGQEFEFDKIIGAYRIYSDNSDTAAKNWTFEASSTGNWSGEEIILDTVSDYSFTSTIGWHSFSILNTESYKYYRLNVSTNNGNSTYLVIREIEMNEYFGNDVYVWKKIENGITSFLDLTDTPATYSGSIGSHLETTESGIEFVSGKHLYSGESTPESYFDCGIDDFYIAKQ